MLIYQITNKKNAKSYIGKTIHSVEHRWGQHKRALTNSHFHRAIRKYGTECFEIKVLEYTDDLNEAERNWIAKLQPEYNMTDGGDGGWIHDQTGNRWKVKDSSRMGYTWRGKQHSSERIEMTSGSNNYQSIYEIHTPWGKFDTWREATQEAKALRKSGNKEVITDVNTLRKYCLAPYILNKEGRRTPKTWRGCNTKDLGFFVIEK